MTEKMPRYTAVNSNWPSPLPLVTRQEAARASAALWRKFATAERSSHGRAPAKWWLQNSARTCVVREPWITRIPEKANSLHGGWRRLIHDMAHNVHSWAYPGKRPHDPTHESLEAEMRAYVLTSGWLEGRLRAVPKAKLTPGQRADAREAAIRERLASWITKQKRATTAIRKLRAQLKARERRKATTACHASCATPTGLSPSG